MVGEKREDTKQRSLALLRRYGGALFDFSIDMTLVFFGALANPILIFVRLGKYVIVWIIKRYSRRAYDVLLKPDS